MSTSTRDIRTKLLAAFMAVLMAFTMSSPFAAGYAWADEGDEGDGGETVITDANATVPIISIVNGTGMPDPDGKVDTGDSRTNLTYAPKSSETDEFTILVNPKAPNMSAANRPTQHGIVITVKSDEEDTDDIAYSMNVTPGQPLKVMKLQPSGDTFKLAATGETIPADDITYDPMTGVMKFKADFQNKSITVYNYLGTNQVGERPEIYAAETLNGSAVTLHGDTVSGNAGGKIAFPTTTFYKQNPTGNNAVFSEMSYNGGDEGFLGYKADEVTAYAATVVGGNVTNAWELVSGQDYQVSTTGRLTVNRDVNANYVIVTSKVVTNPDQAVPFLKSKSADSLSFVKADGYSYSLLRAGAVVADWSSSADFSGLEAGVSYTVQYRNNATGVISKRSFRTSGTAAANFHMPFTVGESFSMNAIPWSTNPYGHTSFNATVSDWASDSNPEGAEVLNNKASGTYVFSCISPGYPDSGKYARGWKFAGTATVTSVNAETGVVGLRVYTHAYVVANSYDGRPCQNMAGTMYVNVEMPMHIDLQKHSDNTIITDGNANYSLEGAVYGIFDNASCTGDPVTTIVTDADGYAGPSEDLKAGTYYVKETDVPVNGNMALSPEIYDVTGKGGDTVTVNGSEGLGETPMTKDWEFYKVDKQSGLSAAQGGAKIEGAEFQVCYYAVRTVADTATVSPTRTWTLSSDANGMVKLDAAHKVSGDDLYQDASGAYVYPCGVYTVKETKAPVGYLLSDPSVHYITMQTTRDEQMSGNTVVRHGTDDLKIADQVKRGDFDLIKINEATQERMAGVPFLVTCNDNGESHVVVTDENGYLNTQTIFNPHTDNTNASDKAVDKNGDGKFTEDEINALDESKLDAYAGVYFYGYSPDHEGYGKVAVEDEQYGLPFGNYTIRELPCKATEGMQIVNPTFNIIRNSYKVEIGTISDHQVTIQTTATDQATNDHEGDPSQETVTILDDVDYRALTPDTKYTLKATLHVKNIDKDGNVTDAGPLMVNGAPVIAEESFTPKTPDGTFTMRFTVPGSALQTKSVVAFEELYEGSRFVIGHTDITDEGQTVNYPGIHTTATDSKTGDHEGNAIDEETTINDEVRYDGLTPGREYTMTGKLMDKATNKPLVDDEGHEFTAETTFTPSASSGSVTLTYTLPTRYVAGKTVVVFEDLYNVRGPVASHADINDEDQTVYYPALRTTATDSITKDHEGLAKDTITINDLVEYENLIKGDTYTISGKVMDKATGEALKGADGKDVTATATFVAGEDATVAEAQELVDVYLEVTKKVLGIYENMTDEEKSDFLEKIDGTELPEFPTYDEMKSIIDQAAKEGTSVLDEHKAMLENFDKFYLSLSDEQKKETTELVSVDKLYSAIETVSAAAADKETSNEGTAPGKPERVSGSVIVSFDIPADAVRGKTTVVFEDLYTGTEPGDDNRKATHSDINDEGQTVVYPEIHTTATIGGEKTAPARDVIVITDTVTYTNLTPGKEYTITGKLMDKVTNDTVKNEDGTEVTGETVFTPEAPDGTVDVTFTFNAMAIQFHDVVVFEEAYRTSDVADELILVAEHKDINDADQTVRIDDAGLADELIESGELPQAGDIVLYALLTIAFLSGCYAFAYRHRKRNLFE